MKQNTPKTFSISSSNFDLLHSLQPGHGKSNKQQSLVSGHGKSNVDVNNLDLNSNKLHSLKPGHGTSDIDTNNLGSK